MTNLQFDLPKDQSSIIKVFGVGGGGSNAVNHMFEQGIVGVNFVICNTDAQALDGSKIPNKIQLGPLLTQGLGAGSQPSMGMQATEESVEEIRTILAKNTKMLFITAGMGGGTGTGGAPVVAKIANELGILTVGIVTTPFSFEGKRKYNQALEGIEKLKEYVDTIIVISNDKIREIYGNAKQSEAFNHANNILTTAAKSISEIITIPGFINVDFADVKHTMQKGGTAVMGSACAEGEGRAMKAVIGALNSPLLNDNDIRGAKKILLNITSGTDQATIDEITEINEYVQDIAKDTDIIFGTCDDETLENKLSVTIIATGFDAINKPGYTKVSNKTVYELNDSQAVVNSVKTVTPLVEQPKLFEMPATKEIQKENFAEGNTLEEIKEEDNNLFTLTPTSEVSNAVVFEFDEIKNNVVTLDEQTEQIEALIHTEVAPVKSAETEGYSQEDLLDLETLLQNEMAEDLATENLTNEPKDEESFITFSVKSYETNSTESVQKVELDNELLDRKAKLAQLSKRSFSNEELENTPAYMRKGIQIENRLASLDANESRFTVSEDATNQRPAIKKDNTFLHDLPD